MGSSIAGNHTTDNFLWLSYASIYLAGQRNSTTTSAIVRFRPVVRLFTTHRVQNLSSICENSAKYSQYARLTLPKYLLVVGGHSVIFGLDKRYNMPVQRIEGAKTAT